MAFAIRALADRIPGRLSPGNPSVVGRLTRYILSASFLPWISRSCCAASTQPTRAKISDRRFCGRVERAEGHKPLVELGPGVVPLALAPEFQFNRERSFRVMQPQLYPNAVRSRSRLRRNTGPIFGGGQSTERCVNWIVVRRRRIHERLENAGLLVCGQRESFHARET